ncbi:hypothetical protein KKC74_09965, partial [bacterium]|nr:hypothetical protein [bacterium]
NEIPRELIEVKSMREGVVSATRQLRVSRKSTNTANSGTPFGNSKEIMPGASVSHKIFGIGKVLNVTGSGERARLQIFFRSCGAKTIVAKFVTLN